MCHNCSLLEWIKLVPLAAFQFLRCLKEQQGEDMEMQGISRKILKSHIFFSHSWREEENAESVLKFSEGIVFAELAKRYLQNVACANFAM